MKKKWTKRISFLTAALTVLTASPVSATELPSELYEETSAENSMDTYEETSAENFIENFGEDTAEGSVENSVKASVEGSVEIPAEGSVENSVKTSVEGSVEIPAEGSVENSAQAGQAGDKVEITEKDKPYLALGADLSEEQRNTVLSLMGIDPSNLAAYDVVYVTNQEEHQYLDSYIESAKIGSRAWSSVVIVEREAGSGLNISTHNITYCTVGMYKNALATAGITDADIIVAGPKGISGTAALVGVFKAYEEMTGEDVGDNVVDAALHELVITGELEAAIDGLSNEEVEEFIAYIKSVIAQNDLSDAQSIDKVISEACEKYGVTLSDTERQQIIDLLLKITSLGINLDGLVDYAQSLYHSYRDGGGSSAGGVLASVGNFLSNAFTAIADFFKGLFS